MSIQSTLYPPGGFGAPKDRRGHAAGDLGLPPGTVVFSADNHISVADDIFYERFPDDLKGAAPRIWYEDGAYMVGMKGKSWVGGDFGRVLMQYDDLAGAASNNIAARIAELRQDGIEKELAFPNAVLALFHYPDKAIRERVFRIYNELMADLQERSGGHFYGVGLINWWDPKRTRANLEELKALGLKTFLLPLNPGKDDDGNIYDYGGAAMDPVWDEIEAAGLPVTHHIGETPPKTPCENNSVVVGMMINVDSFREQFAKYLFSGSWIATPVCRSAGSRVGSPGCRPRCRTPSICWLPTGTCSITNCTTTSGTTGTTTCTPRSWWIRWAWS